MATLTNPPGSFPDKVWSFSVTETVQRSQTLEDEIPEEAGDWGFVDVFPGAAPRYTATVEGQNLSREESENYRIAYLRKGDFIQVTDTLGNTITGLPNGTFSRRQTDRGSTLYVVNFTLLLDYPDPETLDYT